MGVAPSQCVYDEKAPGEIFSRSRVLRCGFSSLSSALFYERIQPARAEGYGSQDDPGEGLESSSNSLTYGAVVI